MEHTAVEHLGFGALLVSLFMTGLVGSLHCVGMCGPILLAFAQILDRDKRGNVDRRSGFLLYHAGRLWTYGVLGFLSGWAGHGIHAGSDHLGWQPPISVGISLVVIISGLAALRLVPGLRFDAAVKTCFWRPPAALTGLLRDPRPAARFLLGAAMGLLPCGMVYTVLVVVASQASPALGALSMLCFGLGTLPALTAVVLGGRAAPAGVRLHGTRIAAALLIGIGLFMLVRALLVSPASHAHGLLVP